MVLTRVIPGRKSELHPLVVIFGVLTGGQNRRDHRQLFVCTGLGDLRIVYRRLQKKPRFQAPISTSPTQSFPASPTAMSSFDQAEELFRTASPVAPRVTCALGASEIWVGTSGRGALEFLLGANGS
jgi:hypothetical protein